MERMADRIHARIQLVAAAGAGHDGIVAAAVDDWRAIEAALSPIVGGRGFAAILQRSLHMLDDPRPQPIDPDVDPIDVWQRVLAERDADDAVDASLRLLRVFCNLLVALIGGSLSERLLRPVWDRPITGGDDQDTTP